MPVLLWIATSRFAVLAMTAKVPPVMLNLFQHP
jgi:hypothetical protein